MNLCRLTSRTQGVCRNALKNFSTISSTKSLSQTASSLITKGNNKNSSSLYRRISPVGDPDISIVPVLDQWVSEGRTVDKDSLDRIIKSLMKFKRFKHALEVSEWMTDRRYIPLTKLDIRDRLHLIYKVYSLEKAEEFYNNISQVFKGFLVDVCLLNIYALEKLEDKAEAMMHKIRETETIRTPLPFNILLNLYYNLGNWEKIDALAKEMEDSGLYFDKYSFTPRLCAYAANGNINGLHMLMETMEADPRVGADSDTYLIAANVFSKAGLVEKSLEFLKKGEKLAMTSKGKYTTLNGMLRMYAKLGKKDEVYRIWNILQGDKIYNEGYRNMISSLMKLDDIEGAERVFKEWETKGLSYDFRIPELLIDGYVKNGELGKAEAVLTSGIEKGGNPNFRAWYCLMMGYFEDDQVGKGVEALKKAALTCRVGANEGVIRDKLVIVMEFLERQHNVQEVEGLMQLLVAEGMFSSTVCKRVTDYIKNKSV